MPPYRTITSNEEPVFFTEDIWPLIIKNCLVTSPLKPKKIVGVGIRIIFSLRTKFLTPVSIHRLSRTCLIGAYIVRPFFDLITSREPLIISPIEINLLNSH